MIKVLIADDERIIREGIMDAIAWQQLGLELVGLAANGKEALDIIERMRPDICLIDIMMPLVNGLELIEKAKEIRQDAVFIIITGFDEFEYAQRAIQLEIFDYLLKPIDEQNLEKTLIKAATRIRERKDKTSHLQYLDHNLNLVLPEAKKLFLLDCLNGEVSLFEISHLSNLYAIRLSNHVGLILLKVSDCIFLGDERFRLSDHELLGKLKTCIDTSLPADLETYVIEEGEMVIILLNLHATAGLPDICSKLESEIKVELNYYCPLYSDETSGGLLNIEPVYARLRRIVEHNGKHLPVVRLIKNFVDENYYDSNLTLKRIAENFHVSVGHISRLFKQELGVSFSSYLETKRIQSAIRQLREGGRKIYEIAARSGFGSQQYFCAVFKKVVGISPSEYKENLSKTNEQD